MGKGGNKGGACDPGGFFICTKCGEKTPHQQEIKCTTLKCSNCGQALIREGLITNKK